MSKMRIALMVGIAAQFSAEIANAQLATWQPSTLTVNGPSTTKDLARTQIVNGATRLRKTDEAETNEMGVVKLFSGNTTGLYVEMRSGELNGALPTDRMQGACTPIKLVQGAGGVVTAEKVPGERFISDNRGNEYRNFNKPELMPINGGKNMLVMFNYQPAGGNDTKRYVKVLDSACKEIPIVNAGNQAQKQIVVMAKNNDDCDMHQSGEGPCDVASDANGVTHLTCWAGCNGNGTDDGWINDITVSCTNDAAGNATQCKVVKNFDASLAQREERSRGRCSVADADPNTAICTWTEGNNQPQRDGTWIAAVDISAGGAKGANAQSRVLWKKMIQGQKQQPGGQRSYSVRANSSRILTEKADGTLERSEMLFVHVSDLIGNNNNNRKGGRYVAQNLGVAKATKTGLEWVVPITDITPMMLGIDSTHLTITGSLVEDAGKTLPAITFLQGSQNGGGGAQPDLKVLSVDLTAKKFVDYGTHAAGGSYDRHLYSNYLGNNPGNQGRNFSGSTVVRNPFYNQNGNVAKYLELHALTGKDPSTVAKPELKPSSYVTIMPMFAKGVPPAPTPGQNGSGGGMNAGGDPGAGTGSGTGMGSGTGTGDGTGTGTGTGETPAQPPSAAGGFAGGCSVASTGNSAVGGLFLMMLGLGLTVLVRRRRA